MKRFLNLKALVLSLFFVTAMSLPGNVNGQVYKKVTSAPDDWYGTYLIVWENGIESKIGANNSTNYLGAYGPVVVNNNTIEGDYSSYEVVAVETTTSGSFYIMRGSQYLNSNSNASNQTWYAKWENSSSSYGTWTLATNGIFRENGVKQLKYNSNNTRFLVCQSSNNFHKQTVLYRRQPEKKEILGAGTGDNNRYYLIASPVTTLTPSTTNGFLREDGDIDYYDLYSFDQSYDDEWRNYKASSFNLLSGKGYLYANKDDVDLVFDGAFRYRKNMTVNLAYTAGQKLAGWNLIGNPYDVTAYLTDGRDFLRMNDDGNGFVVESGGIEAMEGVFVQATGTGQSVTFTVTNPNSSKDAVNPKVVMNVIGNNDNVIDRAIVRFGEGKTLSKLTLREDNTKIYIPKEDGDYAVVRSNGQKNIPVNFKTSKIGRYTISVETEGLNLNYLHLVDKLTEEDIDLLKENKYSFMASSSDDEARFVLAFSANGDYEECETFAYQNGSDVVIRGDGELQVFDVMGRLVAQKRVNGEEIVHVQSQGVYIFRLNGKTQKIVVR